MAEAFSLSFDGSKAVIAKEEFLIDEILITKVTELPSTGDKWFNTTIPKDVEFRSYLNLEHSIMVWKKSVPSSWMEENWKQLMKAIVVYLSYEGRYNRAMIYQFKLMNHFTGKIPLNLPFYLHKSLGKMAHKVKAHPSKIAGRMSHHGLIQLLVQELLKRRNMAWPYFLFWNGFETCLHLEEKGKSLAKKSSTPRSGRRRRRAISLVAATEQPPSSSKTKKAKRNLDFSEKV